MLSEPNVLEEFHAALAAKVAETEKEGKDGKEGKEEKDEKGVKNGKENEVDSFSDISVTNTAGRAAEDDPTAIQDDPTAIRSTISIIIPDTPVPSPSPSTGGNKIRTRDVTLLLLKFANFLTRSQGDILGAAEVYRKAVEVRC